MRTRTPLSEQLLQELGNHREVKPVAQGHTAWVVLPGQSLHIPGRVLGSLVRAPSCGQASPFSTLCLGGFPLLLSTLLPREVPASPAAWKPPSCPVKDLGPQPKAAPSPLVREGKLRLPHPAPGHRLSSRGGAQASHWSPHQPQPSEITPIPHLPLP